MLAWVERWGYIGLFVALFAEEGGVPLPVPGDVFIAALGAAGRAGHASFLVTTLVVLVAATAGSALLFETSRRVGHPLLLKVGRRFGFDVDRADRVERWLAKRGPVAIIVGRLTPGLRIVLTVAAGALHMERSAFLIGAAVASVLWSALYYWLGYLLGAGVAGALERMLGQAVRDPDSVAALVVFGILGVIAFAATIVWRRKRARRRRARLAPEQAAAADDAG